MRALPSLVASALLVAVAVLPSFAAAGVNPNLVEDATAFAEEVAGLVTGNPEGLVQEVTDVVNCTVVAGPSCWIFLPFAVADLLLCLATGC